MLGKDTKVVFPEIEEMKCPDCQEITGHRIVNGLWTCVICGKPLKKTGFFNFKKNN
jgi:ribosomal protein L37AE/L43A